MPEQNMDAMLAELTQHIETMRDALAGGIEQIKQLEARLATAEAERDAALARAREARETAENYLGHCDASCKQLEATEAALLTAQSGEARAVEALKRIVEAPGCGCKPICQCRTLESRSIESEAKMDIATEAIEALQPALAWLAQQRAEAAAAWIEKEAWKARRTMGEYYERSVEGMLEEAAALRAGATGGADA